MSVISSSRSTPSEHLPARVRVSSVATWPLLILLKIYKLLISPMIRSVFGPTCRYEPSCSDYAADAVRKYGAWRGSIMAVKRVSRCHPWHEGGYDPVK